jgi:hypothetical protein
MVRNRFRGSVGRRLKTSPLLINHLNRALGETTSQLEVDTVYANLARASRKANSEENFRGFYLSLAKQEAALSATIDYSGHQTPLDRNEVEEGKRLERELREAVILPKIGHERYESRILQAKHDEYAFLLERNTGKGAGKN